MFKSDEDMIRQLKLEVINDMSGPQIRELLLNHSKKKSSISYRHIKRKLSNIKNDDWIKVVYS